MCLPTFTFTTAIKHPPLRTLMQSKSSEKNYSPCDSLLALDPLHLIGVHNLNMHTGAHVYFQMHTYSAYIPNLYPWMWSVLLWLFFHPWLVAQLSSKEATIHLWIDCCPNQRGEGRTGRPLCQPGQTPPFWGKRDELDLIGLNISENTWMPTTDHNTNVAAYSMLPTEKKKPQDICARSQKPQTEADEHKHWSYLQEILSLTTPCLNYSIQSWPFLVGSEQKGTLTDTVYAQRLSPECITKSWQTSS